MRNKNRDFIDLLYDLCDLYKEYVKKNDGKLDVIIQPDMIKMYLYKNNDLKDEFGLSFDKKEKDIYTYISVCLIRVLFGKMIIYSRNNTFLDSLDSPRIEVAVYDFELSDKMFNLMTLYNDKTSRDNKRLRSKVNKVGDSDLFEQRLKLTRSLIENRGI